MSLDVVQRPRGRTSKADQELQKAEDNFNRFEESVKKVSDNITITAPQNKPELQITQKQLNNAQAIYLKPEKFVASHEKFNEKFRSEYEFAKEIVCFIAHNNEVKGETIVEWTKPFPGCQALMWRVPVGKVVYGPRYLAEQLQKAQYSKLTMEGDETAMAQQNMNMKMNQATIDCNQVIVEEKIQRLDATPVVQNKSVFHQIGFTPEGK